MEDYSSTYNRLFGDSRSDPSITPRPPPRSPRGSSPAHAGSRPQSPVATPLMSPRQTLRKMNIPNTPRTQHREDFGVGFMRSGGVKNFRDERTRGVQDIIDRDATALKQEPPPRCNRTTAPTQTTHQDLNRRRSVQSPPSRNLLGLGGALAREVDHQKQSGFLGPSKGRENTAARMANSTFQENVPCNSMDKVDQNGLPAWTQPAWSEPRSERSSIAPLQPRGMQECRSPLMSHRRTEMRVMSPSGCIAGSKAQPGIRQSEDRVGAIVFQAPQVRDPSEQRARAVEAWGMSSSRAGSPALEAAAGGSSASVAGSRDCGERSALPFGVLDLRACQSSPRLSPRGSTHGRASPSLGGSSLGGSTTQLRPERNMPRQQDDSHLGYFLHSGRRHYTAGQTASDAGGKIIDGLDDGRRQVKLHEHCNDGHAGRSAQEPLLSMDTESNTAPQSLELRPDHLVPPHVLMGCKSDQQLIDRKGAPQGGQVINEWRFRTREVAARRSRAANDTKWR